MWIIKCFEKMRSSYGGHYLEFNILLVTITTKCSRGIWLSNLFILVGSNTHKYKKKKKKMLFFSTGRPMFPLANVYF